jgi:hypothetical protein
VLGWGCACPPPHPHHACGSLWTCRDKDCFGARYYPGYKMSLCYLLSRIMEQLLTQGRIWEAAWKWGGKLKYPGNCPVLGYLSWSWNKEKEVMVPLYKSLSLPLRYSTSLQSKGYCYCLGVGEASWKKSVVWGNVKEAAFVLIRREGIRRGLKCLQTTAELKVLSVKLTEETAAVGPSWGAQAKDASLDPYHFFILSFISQGPR